MKTSLAKLPHYHQGCFETIVRIIPKDPFLLRARESYDIWKFQTEKRMGILDIEHGLNLDAGQQ